MRLTDILKSDDIIANLSGHDKESVLSEFAKLAAQRLVPISSDQIEVVLIERERLGSTAVGHGVAIPHGKVPGLQRMVAFFGRSTKGVDFGSHDDQPTYIFFVILAPENAVSQHLQALARLSRLLKDPRIRESLIQCTSADLYQVLMAEDAKL